MMQELEMVPMLMQEGFRAQGWLGLILGTRMYFKFYASAVETEADFIQQMDMLSREIGDRGRIKTLATAGSSKANVSEGVPPRALGPAPAPAPTPMSTAFEPTPEPAPAPVRALAPAATPDRGSFSPSMQQQQQQQLSSPASRPMIQHDIVPRAAIGSGGGGGSFSEMALFFKEQREEAKAERAGVKPNASASIFVLNRGPPHGNRQFAKTGLG